MSTVDIPRLYHRFAEVEARGSSALYEMWALGIAEDDEVQSLLVTLTGMKRQPNLVFAAARFAGAPLAPYPEFRAWLLRNWDEVRAVILRRSTQTNEPARCATILPALAEISGPIALIEVGASAGLCLFPDRYSYRYATVSRVHSLDPTDGPSDVLIDCEFIGSPPERMPEIVWRAGVDLSPIDLRHPEALAWLETLIWPEHRERVGRMRRAAQLAATNPPTIVQGDLVDALPALAAQAPSGATLVVFHSAVLAYVDEGVRERFASLVAKLGATWISNEGPTVLPRIARRLPKSVDASRRFIVGVNGMPHGLSGPHGQSYESLG